jgi:hypothetical protein
MATTCFTCNEERKTLIQCDDPTCQESCCDSCWAELNEPSGPLYCPNCLRPSREINPLLRDLLPYLAPNGSRMGKATSGRCSTCDGDRKPLIRCEDPRCQQASCPLCWAKATGPLGEAQCPVCRRERVDEKELWDLPKP